MTTASRTRHANAARRQATDRLLQRIRTAITDLRRERHPITVSTVRHRAGCSRSFLYQNQTARELLAAGAVQPPPDAPRRSSVDGPWRERALNAEAGLKTAHTEIRAQRTRLGELLGRVRDLEADLPIDATQRLQSENTTLRLEVRKRTEDNRNLRERLTAARMNYQSQDAAIADLQARLVEISGPGRDLRSR